MCSCVIVNYNSSDPNDRSQLKYQAEEAEEIHMKSHRFLLFLVLLSVSVSTVAFAQSEAQKPSVAPVPSVAEKCFTTMKSLAGEWEAPVNVPEVPEMSNGKPIH